MIIPSIDIMNGKAVQLEQGQKKVLERTDIFELAQYFSRFGEIAVIDLDAAMNKGNNEEIIKQLCAKFSCRVGGGIRDKEKAQRLISYGAKKIIIGTAANEEFLSKLPKDRLIVAIDAKNGNVVTKGWAENTGETPENWIRRFDNLCSGYLYTIVEKEGMMGGTDLEAIKKVSEFTKNPITAAGGICTIQEIIELEKINISSQLGMAIYTNALSLEDAFCAVLDFKKQQGLIPTIVQDVKTKQVLMLAYSNEEAVKKSLKTGKATYFSRSRNELWTKGETSGNVQKLVNAKFDCDRDTLLYKVEQTGPACHLGRFSCFEDRDFVLEDLYDLLLERKANLPEKSFTTKLFKDAAFLNSKILEEANEVVDFENGEDDLGWEAADLTYFVLALMAKHNINPQEVLNNLASRRK